jgi:integrase
LPTRGRRLEWRGIRRCPKELLDAIAATTHSTTHYLVTEYGRAFTSSASFGNKFADWASKAGVKKTPHGLRVTCAIRYAESECTAHQLMSIMAWASIKEAEEYCRKAARQTMAAAAGGLLVE